MFNEILLRSFKSFTKTSIQLFPLTVLTGLNNSGKSSVIQAIRMSNLARRNLSPYIKGYGGYLDLKSKLTNSQTKVRVALANKKDKKHLTLVLDQKDIKNYHNIEKISLDYISADRRGPSVTLPVMEKEVDDITIGERGEYLVDYYAKFEGVIIPKILRHQLSSGNTLKHQINHWMSEVSPGVDLSFNVNEDHDISHMDVNGFRSTNTGFGISYALPIVLAVLVMSSSSPVDSFKSLKIQKWHACRNKILMIENPEAHLHPRGQTALGMLITLASYCGVQIIVETHSDHFIDGVRLAIKNFEQIPPENCIIHYFTRDKDKSTKSEEIFIKRDGKLTSWPKGFFDQNSINLSQLAKRK